jgi:ketosteroid isomerase-like protein
MSTSADNTDIEMVIRSWERAVQSGDMDGILANHSESVLMFDSQDLRITAGDKVAFAPEAQRQMGDCARAPLCSPQTQ